MCTGRSKFPYNALCESLKVLDSTKSVVMDEKEISQNNLTFLRKIVKDNTGWFVNVAKQDGKVYLWVNK